MSVSKQLVREFWFPLLAAIGWSIYNVSSDTSVEWTITKIINVFGPTFFLASWLTSQYFRVRKQTKVENDLLRIQAATADMLSQLEHKTSDLVAHFTGGDSFCYITLSSLVPGVNAGVIIVVHCGKHVLYDVSANIVDLQGIKAKKDTVGFEYTSDIKRHRSFGNIAPGFEDSHEVWDLGDNDRRDFDITWTARNGRFTQLLRFRKVDNRWRRAIKVEREGTIFEQVQEGYPRNVDGGVDWR